MVFLPIQLIRDRIQIDRQESDSALFMTLLYYGEMVVKLITAGMIAAVQYDRDRHRYRQVHRLVRADGLGEWQASLQEVLVGPASQFLEVSARTERKELTQRCRRDSWQHQATTLLNDCLSAVDIDTSSAGAQLSCMHWIDSFVVLRNKTRGHGAKKSSKLASVCEHLQQSIALVADNLGLFQRPCAYIKRNLSGKYRVTLLGGDRSPFEDLKHRTDVSLDDGVYILFDTLCRAELVHSDPEASDFLFPNGSFTDKRYEVLSYITGDNQFEPSAAYLEPAERLPPSETEGLGNLNVHGNCFSNIPTEHRDYVPRTTLENLLREQLFLDRHPIVSLTGRGGIGKTLLALQVIQDMVAKDLPRFDVIVWFSARDIDLLPQGPKIVRAAGVTLKDFGRIFAELLEVPERNQKGFDDVQYLGSEMTKGSYGPTLYVFDNFETVANPGEIYSWIDSFIRPPNKVLITTRIRGDFAADYPVQVGGMNEEECDTLIVNTAKALGIDRLMTNDYRREFIDESDGHPYVIKVLLGEVAKAGKRRKVERLIASHDEILTALFERTYGVLSPVAQRVFLTLSNWKSTVPEIALEAVMLRPANEKMDVKVAVEELIQSSFVEVLSSEDGDTFLHVPLAASLFGKRKLVASPWKAAVDADSELLRAFGATQRTDVRHGLSPRINRFFKNVAQSVSRGGVILEEIGATLEFVCRRHPDGWLLLADLYSETDLIKWAEKIKYCLQHYLETERGKPEDSWVWKRLADVCRDTRDVVGEFHAISEMCKVRDLPLQVLTSAANRINSRLSELPYDERRQLGRDEKQQLIGVVAKALYERLDQLDGKGCSRLAWLYIHLGNEERAKEIAEHGIGLDADDPHCQNLYERLSRGGACK